MAAIQRIFASLLVFLYSRKGNKTYLMQMKYLLILGLSLVGKLYAQAQQELPCNNADRTYTKVPVAPEFGNSPDDLQKYFDTAFANVKKSKGELRVTFIVDSSGITMLPRIDRMNVETIDEEVVKRVILNMPKWKPGKSGNCDVKAFEMLVFDVNKKSIRLKIKQP